MSSQQQEQRPSSKKQRLLQVVVDEGDTKETLMARAEKQADKEIRFKDRKNLFLGNIAPHKECFEKCKQDQVDSLMSYILHNARPDTILANVAKKTHHEITGELNKFPKDTQEYILETTDVYYPLQYHDTKKGALREVLREVLERVELLEEKDL